MESVEASVGIAVMINWNLEFVDVDGYLDQKYGIEYKGIAVKQPNGLYRALAVIGTALCVVEGRISKADAQSDKVTREGA